MRIALYARKSTEQEDRQVQSLEDQVRELTRLAHREHLSISMVFKEAHSAKVPGARAMFEELLAEVEAGRIEGILTWSMNRIARNPIDGARVAYLLQTGRLALIRTIDRHYRPDDNALLLSIETGLATAYIQDLSRNVRRGMRGKVERGWHSSKAPIGYKNDAESREISVDHTRFPIIREGWEKLLAGTSVSEVHRSFQRSRLTVPSRRGREKVISRTGVHFLFRNPFYAGFIRYNGENLPGKHKAMVSPEEFDRVQTLIRRGNLATTTKPKLVFAFAGTMRCANCGCVILGERRSKTYPQTKRTVAYTYYHCSGSKGCSKTAVREEQVAGWFDELVEQFENVTPSIGAWLKEAVDKRLEESVPQVTAAATRLDAEILRERSRLEQLIIMRADGEISIGEFGDLRAKSIKAVEELESERSKLQSGITSGRELAHHYVDIAVRAGELVGGDADPFALGKLMRATGPHLLNLKTPILTTAPVLKKIVAFEPIRVGSEAPKDHDRAYVNTDWWTLVDEILNLVALGPTEQLCTDNLMDQAKSRHGE